MYTNNKGGNAGGGGVGRRATKGKHLCASIAGCPMFQKNNLMDIDQSGSFNMKTKKTFGHTPQLINKKDN